MGIFTEKQLAHIIFESSGYYEDSNGKIYLKIHHLSSLMRHIRQ